MKEPTIILGAVSEVIKAFIPMLIIFGIIHWTAEQVAAVMLFVGAGIAAINIAVTRSQTTSTPTVDALIKTAVASAPGTSVEAVKDAVANQ